jgi:hypothetical protein
MSPMNPRLLRPIASTGIDPASIAGLDTWIDAADASTVTLDSGRVATIANKSGLTNRDFANSTSGSTQPDYIIGGQNGRNVIRFAAASSQRLAGPSTPLNFLHNGTPCYMAAVFASSAGFIFSNSIYANNALRGISVIHSGTIGVSDGTTSAASGTVAAISQTNFFPSGQHVVLDAVLDVGNAVAADRLVMRVNGVGSTSPNTATAAPAAGGAQRPTYFGCNGNAGVFLTGDICEWLIYSQHPTVSQQAAIRKYLSRKWGVSSL